MAKKLDQYALEGINLAKKKQYSLTQFQDLAEMIQDQTGKKIEEAPVFNADQAHVYARVEDWVPEYNTQAAGLSTLLGSFLDEIVVDVPDKIITLIVVYFVLKGLPRKLTALYDANAKIEHLE